MSRFIPVRRVWQIALGLFALALVVTALTMPLLHARASTRTTRLQLSDTLLDPSKFVVKSTLQIDLTRGTATLPLHRGQYQGQTVWYIITDASDFGLAHDLGANYAPKLANVPVGCPECVQNVTLTTPANNKFGDAIVNFAGIPDFRPTRQLQAAPAPNAFPPVVAQPGAVAGPGYSPFIRILGSPVIYNAPIVAVGNGPFDLSHHTNTHDRVVGIDTQKGTVELLLVNGFDAHQPILYLSTDASTPLAATLERAIYVPVLNKLSFLGGDDFLGSARERIFGLINGQTGATNPQAQGFNHLLLDTGAALDATPENIGTGKAIDHADPLNVQGDFPTLADPMHANAYSPAWDLQLGQWTNAAVSQGLNTRQTDENDILNLVNQGLITGPGGAPFGSVGIVINCPPIAFLNEAPTNP
ncbi:DUF7482 domain-containing protein [Dictyobacter aurantiacus]|uniref:DUF7482 domain-containing protein n=1 Tax=Dictyobacter aurantiacus TaxID=1936993 RepID=A0A401ZLU7_9CHLR|nr:hypothetical protein [Dictyobacter aurantiacus]GCE07794.1 hypothetical protein KDAU_51230 [Dictyobacter aurantiacus]